MLQPYIESATELSDNAFCQIILFVDWISYDTSKKLSIRLAEHTGL